MRFIHARNLSRLLHTHVSLIHKHVFRQPLERMFSILEQIALRRCNGMVLEVGVRWYAMRCCRLRWRRRPTSAMRYGAGWDVAHLSR